MENTNEVKFEDKYEGRYKTKRLTGRIGLDEFLGSGFIDPERFLACCKECPSYVRLWSCPPYDFNIEGYWRKFSILTVIGIQIIPDQELRSKIYRQPEAQALLDKFRTEEKKRFTQELFEIQKSTPGSVLLTVGSCDLCTNCTRPAGKPCVHPDKMRYSIESLGGNVDKIVRDLLGTELLWIKDGLLPDHTMLVGGLLEP